MLVPPSPILLRVQDYVRMHADLTRGYLLLKEHGSWHYNDGSIHPKAGDVKQCFNNVYVTMFQNLGCAMYGVAVSEDLGVPFFHAWRLQETGVVELTPSWTAPTWYFGILIPDGQVSDLCHLNTPALQDVLFATQWASSRLNDRLADAVIKANAVVLTTCWRDLPSVLLYRVLCFVSAAYPMKLKGALLVNKDFHAAVKERFLQLGAAAPGADEDLFDLHGNTGCPPEQTWGDVKLHYYERYTTPLPAFVSKKWLMLVISWNQLNRYLLSIRNMCYSAVDHTLAFVADAQKWRYLQLEMQQAVQFFGRPNGDSEFFSWQMKVLSIREEARNKFYMNLCKLIELPPDENTIRPRPPKAWPLNQTYLVRDCGDFKNVEARNMETNQIERICLNEVDTGHSLTCIDRYGVPRSEGVLYRGYLNERGNNMSDDFKKRLADSISDGFLLDPDYAIVGALFVRRFSRGLLQR